MRGRFLSYTSHTPPSATRIAAIAARESLHGMIWRNRLSPRKDSRLPQHAYILPPSLPHSVPFFYFISPCFLSGTSSRIRTAARPLEIALSRCSLFLAPFAPSSIKICFAVRKYFVRVPRCAAKWSRSRTTTGRVLSFHRMITRPPIDSPCLLTCLFFYFQRSITRGFTMTWRISKKKY